MRFKIKGVDLYFQDGLLPHLRVHGDSCHGPCVTHELIIDDYSRRNSVGSDLPKISGI